VRNLAVVICGVTMMLAGARNARAAFVASIDFTSASPLNSAIEATVGYVFAVGGAPVSVVSLGLHVDTTQGTVRLYEIGTAANLASAAIDGSDPLSEDARYRYEVLASPLLLSAGTTYAVVVDINSEVVLHRFATGIVTSPRLSFGYGISQLFATGGFPNADVSSTGPYFGPSLQIQVPEPSTWIPLATGLLGFAVRRRRKACA
jgi:hypothetical protein